MRSARGGRRNATSEHNGVGRTPRHTKATSQQQSAEERWKGPLFDVSRRSAESEWEGGKDEKGDDETRRRLRQRRRRQSDGTEERRGSGDARLARVSRPVLATHAILAQTKSE
uniref:Uncharacterized protein n=1 Tax=Plectus sambesii TaxID=2011161 RepID=A0A914WPJ4_9BILA